MTAVRGVQIARAVTSLSWSGLATRSSISNLQALATTSARDFGATRFKQFGIASRARGTNGNRSFGVGGLSRNRTNGVDVGGGRIIKKKHQLERLSRFFWHRDRLAALRGNWMYFYTDLENRDGKGL